MPNNIDRGMPFSEIRRLINGSAWLDFSRFRIGEIGGYANGVFGTKAAFHSCIEYVYHEVAHAIDFYLSGEIERIGFDRFRFDLPFTEVFGQIVCEPVSLKCTEREIRATAIQLVLLLDNKLLNVDINEFVDSSARPFIHMPDFLNVPCNDDLDYDERVRSKIEWIKRRILSQVELVSIEECISVWPSVLDRIDIAKKEFFAEYNNIDFDHSYGVTS